MIEAVALHALLSEFRRGESSGFYLANEAKNIFMELQDTRALEQALLGFLSTLNETEQRLVLPVLATTSRALLNRLALYELQPLLDASAMQAMAARVADPLLEVPKDTVELLVSMGLTLDAAYAQKLIAAHAWQTLEAIAPALAGCSIEEKQAIKTALSAAPASVQSYRVHGIEISRFDAEGFLEALAF